MNALDTAAADVTSLSLSFKGVDDATVDARIGRFAALHDLWLTACPARFEIDAALLTLPIRELHVRGASDLDVRLPAVIARAPLTVLSLSNVELASVVLPPTLQELRVWVRHRDDLGILLALASTAPALRTLTIIAEGDASGAPVPVGLHHLPSLQRLALSQCGAPWPADLGACKTLRDLDVTIRDLDTDLRELCALAPQLVELKVSSERSVEGALPDCWQGMQHLESLTLAVQVRSLPPSLTSLPRLRSLSLSRLPGRELPDLSAMPALSSLTLDGHLNTLPESLAGVAGTLRVLRLSGVLNNGALVSRFDASNRLKALPAVVGKLTALEELDLSQCGIIDIAPLATLTRLRVLKLNWNPIEDLTPLAALSSLEELDLEHVDRVTDLAPLSALSQLRRLNLKNMRPRSLAPLTSLPNLTHLDLQSFEGRDVSAVFQLDVALEADDELLTRYQHRLVLRRLPPVETLVADLGSGDVAVVERALDQLSTWITSSSTRDHNAAEQALRGAAAPPVRDEEEDEEEDEDEDNEDNEDNEDEDDANTGTEDANDDDNDAGSWRALPALDRALARHVEQLSTTVLARVFAAVFQRMEENYAAALVSARAVAARGDDDDQRALSRAFLNASTYYDVGHRMWEDTVQDLLIEEVLPTLRAPALLELVLGLSSGHFFEDGMQELWTTALDGVTTSSDAIAAHLLSVWQDRVQYGSDDEVDSFAAVLDAVTAPGGVAVVARTRTAMHAQLQAKRVRAEHVARLQSNDPDVVAAAIATTIALPAEEREELRSALRRALVCDGLSDDAVAQLARYWHADGSHYDLSAVLAVVATRPLAEARALLDTTDIPAAEAASHLYDGIVRTLDEALAAKRRGWNRDDDDTEEEDGDADRLPSLPEPPGVVAQRRLARVLADHDDDTGSRAELEAAARRLGHFDQHKLAVFCMLVATATPPIAGGTFSLSKKALSELAGDIGQCAEDDDALPSLRLLARHLPRLELTGQLLERILAQLLGVCVRAGDAEAVSCVLALIPRDPDEVKWDILTYNLACHHAVSGDRDGLLRWTRRSLAVGKSAGQFDADTDFDAWRADPEFVALLATAR